MRANVRSDRTTSCLRLAAVAATLVLACSSQQPSGPAAGSETHFLKHCDSTCPTAMDCLCGACSRVCSESAECTSLAPIAQCAAVGPRIAAGRCAPTESSAMCDVTCLLDRDCASLGSEFTCQSGFCRAAVSNDVADAGPPTSCEPLDLLPNDVLVLGDSLIELSSFASRVEQQAAQSGLLTDAEHFRVHASSLLSMLADGPLALATQYAAAREQGPLRLVIMDGGEPDVLNEVCAAPPTPDCAAMQSAASGAKNLLTTMAADGVEHVAYFFYPDPNGNPGVKQRLDVLRPLIENVCGQVPIACHWVDLRASFDGHPEYLAADGLVFSDSGAAVAAQAIWQMLQRRCVVP